MPLETIINKPIFDNSVQPESYPNFKDEIGEFEYFFYYLTKFKGKTVVMQEKGIGYLYGDDFVRDKVIAIGNEGTMQSPTKDKLLEFTIDESDEYIVLRSTFPDNFLECYSIPHSVVTSSEDSLNILEMPPNTLLGRFEQDIAPISMASIVSYLLEDKTFIEMMRIKLS